MHTHCTRRNSLTANLLYSPLCLYLRTAERRIRSIRTSYLLRHEQSWEFSFFLSLSPGTLLGIIWADQQGRSLIVLYTYSIFHVHVLYRILILTHSFDVTAIEC